MSWLDVTRKNLTIHPTEIQEKPLSSPSIPLRIIKNVHKDDIHALVSLDNGTFASGSKDTTIKIWDRNWSHTKTLQHSTQKKFHTYCHWITAMTVFKNGYFATATRDGSLAIWSEEGDEISCCQKQIRAGNVSKERNIYRINCLQQLPVKNDQYLFLVGLPTRLSTWKWNYDNSLNEVLSTKVHDNDWVYCIKKLNDDDFLIAIGSDLEIWRKKDTSKGIIQNWEQRKIVIKENPMEITYNEKKKKQRPHISCMEYISKEKMGLACFGGYVKILDIEKEMDISTFKYHEGRVWTLAKITDSLFATGADDHTALLWDVRQNLPAISLIGKGIGRVSCLLSVDENSLVGTSCPDDLRNASERGAFTIWDLRKH